MKLRRLFFLLFLFGDGCIQPLNIELYSQQVSIVVDGMITDQPGPYLVKLFKTKPLDSQLEGPDWIKGAAVTLFDDAGNMEDLTEYLPGNYQTSPTGMVGVIGRSYFIKIVTSGQSVYESLPEVLMPVADIEDLSFEFILSEDPLKSDHLKTKNGFKLFVKTAVPRKNNGIRWRVTGMYEVKTAPETKTTTRGGAAGSIIIVPDPPPCSGWSYNPRLGLVQGSKLCSCCNCWITEFNDKPLLADTKFNKEGDFFKMNVGFIPASKRTFFNKYFIEVEQFSISKNTSDFWDKLRQQQQTGSDLFQVPPPKTVGNIKSVTPGATPVLGLFSASSVKKKSMFIDKTSIPYQLPEIDVIPESCLQLSKYSSNVKPLFW